MLESVVAWLHGHYAAEVLVATWGTLFLHYAVLALLERLAPAERGQTLKPIVTNLGITLTFLLLTPIANYLPGLAAHYVVQLCGGSVFVLDLPTLLGGQGEVMRWGLQLVFALVPLLVFDFFYYWFHRWQHSNAWLWHVHRLHHTDQSVNVTTSLRHHWLEEPLRSILILIPMNLLFQITPVQSGLLGILLGAWGYVIHMNVRLHLGPLGNVFVGPQGHRIHHSIVSQHLNKNFAAFFPIWDIVFGTFYLPKRDEYPATGVASAPSDPGIGAVLVGPFFAWRNS